MKDLIIANEEAAELRYYITKQKIYYEEIGIATLSYGFEIEKIKKDEVEISRVNDVTCNSCEALKIIELLKNNKVLPVHLEDVILDILS